MNWWFFFIYLEVSHWFRDFGGFLIVLEDDLPLDYFNKNFLAPRLTSRRCLLLTKFCLLIVLKTSILKHKRHLPQMWLPIQIKTIRLTKMPSLMGSLYQLSTSNAHTPLFCIVRKPFTSLAFHLSCKFHSKSHCFIFLKCKLWIFLF